MIQKILIIKHGALGDLILSTGAMNEIKKRWPTAHFTLLTTSPFVKMMHQCPVFDEILVDDRPTFNMLNWYRVCKDILADGDFDLIFNLQLSGRVQKKYYTLARLMSKKPFCWAYFDNNGVIVKQVAAKPRFFWGTEKIQRLDIPWTKGDLSFLKGEQKYFHLLPEKYVLLIPGCSAANAYKRWPADKYAALANKLVEQNIPCVVLGTRAEAEQINEILRLAPTAIDFMDKSSLLDIPALAQRALVSVGNDTGPTHMASLGPNPVVALFCARTAHAARPFDNVTNLIGNDIADISVDQVYDAVLNRMRN